MVANLQVFEQYRFGPRSVLVPGDRFRATGGPVYVTDDGREIPMAERGVFVFRRFCVRGGAKWLEAFNQTDRVHAVLTVGKSSRSRIDPNMRRRPYRVTSKVLEPTPKREPTVNSRRPKTRVTK